MADPFEPVFRALRERMLRSSDGMNVSIEEPGNIVLKTRWLQRGQDKPAWFGAVQIKKNYVSYHLMPLYCLPILREQISPELQKRMQGKSCFNFKKIEPELFDALERLTGACAAAYAGPVDAKSN